MLNHIQTPLSIIFNDLNNLGIGILFNTRYIQSFIISRLAPVKFIITLSLIPHFINCIIPYLDMISIVVFNIAVFKKLGMDQTKERNAVLFHVNFEKKYLTIIGDKGIHEKVHQKFWNDLHDKITQAFSEGKYYQGLHDAILETGMELKNFFPIKDGENPNELSNEITFS